MLAADPDDNRDRLVRQVVNPGVVDGVVQVLAGGGALLAGLDRRVAEATQMPVHIADDPLTCVARGTGVVLQQLTNPTMERVLVADTYSRPLR